MSAPITTWWVKCSTGQGATEIKSVAAVAFSVDKGHLFFWPDEVDDDEDMEIMQPLAAFAKGTWFDVVPATTTQATQ